MENPYIKERTEDTPEFYMDNKTGEIKITGQSFPENAFESYKDVFDWITKYGEGLDSIVCSFDYTILSSASTKMIFEIMTRLLDLSKKGKNISIKWYYEKFDEDMFKEGYGFKKHLSIPVELIAK